MATVNSPSVAPSLAPWSDPPDRRLHEYLAAVRASVRFILVCTALGLVGGCAAVIATPVTHESTFTVLIPVLPEYPAAGTNDLSARVDTIDTASRDLIAITRSAVGTSDISITVAAPPLSRLLQVHLSGSDPQAVEEASEIATRQFVIKYGHDQQDAATALRQSLMTQAGQLSSDISTLRNTARDLPTGDPRRAALQPSVRRLSSALSTLNGTIDEIATREYTAPEIVKAPSPVRTVRTGKTVKLSSGLMLGLLAGLAGSWMRNGRKWDAQSVRPDHSSQEPT